MVYIVGVFMCHQPLKIIIIIGTNNAELWQSDDTCNETRWDRKFEVNLDSMTGDSKYLKPAEVTVFTDGNKTKDGIGVGYVIYIRGNRLRTYSCKLSENATVFQAEVQAIYRASEYLIALTGEYKFKYVKILTDSQAALQACLLYTSPSPRD